MVLGQSGEVRVQLREGLVIPASRFGRGDKTVRDKSRKEGGCEQRDWVFGVCRLV